VAGVAVFLAFLLFAVQLSVNLYATSTVSAAGHDAARAVASRRVDHQDPASVAAAQAAAEQQLRQVMGSLAEGAQVSWIGDGEVVRLRLVVDAPGILPPDLANGTGLRRIDRSFSVRIEQER
jgi:Flp pilus assembly protein TadG